MDYWDDFSKDCIEGVWGNDSKGDKGGYRWCPGNLYFYINATEIKIEGEEGSEKKARPSLRDVEWLIFYALTECDGFSGFEGDEKYTCYRPLGKLQGKIKDKNGNEIKLKNYERILLEKNDKHLRKPNGEYKEYLDVKKILYKTYDKPLGKARYLNEKKNLVILSTRSVGKSFSVSGGVITYDFVFGSSRTLNDFKEMNNPSVTVVGSWDSGKSKELLNKFENQYEYLRKSIGVHPEVSVEEEPCPIYQGFEGSFGESKGFVTNNIRNSSGKGFTGTGSKISHVSFYNNESAAVGERSKIIVEEAGLLKNFEKVHNENAGNQRRETKMYYTVYIGTGGNMEYIQGIREAFYNPEGFDCVGFDDVFTGKKNKIGLFIPAYYRKSIYKDPQGNTKYEKAFEDEIMEREEILQKSKKKYQGHIVSFPIYPHEMFLNNNKNPFDTELLEKRLNELETGEWDDKAKFVRLFYTNDENTRAHYENIPLSEAHPIKRWGEEKDMSDKELKGCPVIYEHPENSLVDFDHVNFRFLVTYDPVRNEEGGTSIASVTVWKFWEPEDLERIQFNVVAEWKGRHIGPNGLDKDHEIAFKFAAYYNCPILPEINIRDIIRHARMTDRYFMLLPKPGLGLGEMKVQSRKNYDVGVKILSGMKPDLERYLNEVFITPVASQEIIDRDNYYTKNVHMIEECYSMRLIEEALYYNRDDGNYDAISDAFLFGIAARQREKAPQDGEYENTNEQEDEFLNFISNEQEYTQINPAFNY